MGKTRDLFKKIRDTKGTFHAKMGLIKDTNGMDLTEAEDIKKRWQEYTALMYSFSYLESVYCSMSSSKCCFLTCIQVSQEAGQVVWYFHLFQNFPQFIVIHTAKGFGIVNKAEIDVFLELSCFFDDPVDVGNLVSGSSVFSKTSLNIWKFMVHIAEAWLGGILSITLLACEMSAIVQ